MYVYNLAPHSLIIVHSVHDAFINDTDRIMHPNRITPLGTNMPPI